MVALRLAACAAEAIIACITDQVYDAPILVNIFTAGRIRLVGFALAVTARMTILAAEALMLYAALLRMDVELASFRHPDHPSR